MSESMMKLFVLSMKEEIQPTRYGKVTLVDE